MKSLFKKQNLIIAGFVILAAALAYGGYRFYLLNQDFESTRADLEETKQELSEAQESFSARRQAMETEIAQLEQDKRFLNEALQNEKEKNQDLQETVEDMSKEIEDYKRLDQLDLEILKKYSKVYFLSEHYTPSSLTLLENRYLYYEDESEQIHTKVKPFLVDLLEAAKNDGIELYVRSGYRSFGTQSSLKDRYRVLYGSGTANSFSAEQGYSEHQLGTTVDFITTGINGTLDGFGNTEAFQWLQENAHRYGFVLSYPEENDYYVYEPWHWRFVGEELASYLENNDLHFYEMEQREIDDYLLNVFEE